jgi:hypothetical protein
MDQQIYRKMREAMLDLLNEMFSKTILEKADVDWIRRLCEELRDRINGLTPRRQDLQIAFSAQFDVDLIVQMVANNAFDDTEKKRVCDAIFERLRMLCAPSQDAHVESLHKDAYKMHLGQLLFDAHGVLDEIDRLSTLPPATTVKKILTTGSA